MAAPRKDLTPIMYSILGKTLGRATQTPFDAHTVRTPRPQSLPRAILAQGAAVFAGATVGVKADGVLKMVVVVGDRGDGDGGLVAAIFDRHWGVHAITFAGPLSDYATLHTHLGAVFLAEDVGGVLLMFDVLMLDGVALVDEGTLTPARRVMLDAVFPSEVEAMISGDDLSGTDHRVVSLVAKPVCAPEHLLVEANRIALPRGVGNDGYIINLPGTVELATCNFTYKIKPLTKQTVDLIIEIFPAGPTAPATGASKITGGYWPYTSASGDKYVIRLCAHNAARREVSVDIARSETGFTYSTQLRSRRQPVLDAIAKTTLSDGPFTTVVECLAKVRRAEHIGGTDVSLLVVKVRNDKISEHGTLEPNALRTVLRTFDDARSDVKPEEIVAACTRQGPPLR